MSTQVNPIPQDLQAFLHGATDREATLDEIAANFDNIKSINYETGTITFNSGNTLTISENGKEAVYQSAELGSVSVDMNDAENPQVEMNVNGVQNGSPVEESAEAALEEVIAQQAIEESDHNKNTGRGKSGKGGSWWMALFAKLGEQLNAEAAELESQLDSISAGNDQPGDLLLASAQMQRLGFMMSQDGAIVSSFGQGSKGLAEGAK